MPRVCNISAELLKGGGEAITLGVQVVYSMKVTESLFQEIYIIHLLQPHTHTKKSLLFIKTTKPKNLNHNILQMIGVN